ncbi:hypothetical protein [Pararhodobacter sp.]|uniref:hypothetical protein n=1 Tax=Pararhodobacter sp. TaxID=2127056 RepID=UPI002FDF0957
MSWISLSDVNPKHGALLMREGSAEISSGGDYTAEIVEVNPETDAGGRDRVFRLRQGSVFVSAANLPAALETIGARLQDGKFITQDSDGQDMCLDPGTPAADRLMLMAAHASHGMDDEEMTVLVSIGLPGHMDAGPVFGSPDIYYPERTSLWAIMRGNFRGFDHAPEKEPAVAVPFDFHGIPDEIRTRADLMAMEDFYGLEVDTSGNPCVWKNHYVHEECTAIDVAAGEAPPSWTDTWSCQCDDECPECGQSVSPHESLWLGPQDPHLRELWEGLPEKEMPEVIASPEPF